MSDNIPFEIQEEIIKKLPVKPIIKFRSVSKAWKSLIDSSDFIARYSAQKTQPQHVIVREEDYVMRIYTRFAVDDDSVTQQRVILKDPWLVYSLKYHGLYGYSHGVLCFFSHCCQDDDNTGRAVLWNPWIRKAVAVILPNVKYGAYGIHVSFGVCRETMEPKLVKITQYCFPWQYEVFTLSTGVWRSPHGNLPRNSVIFKLGLAHQVTVNGFIYWIGNDENTMDGGYSLLISFDLTTEEFGEVNLRDSLALEKHTNHNLSISKLRNSLVVLEYVKDVNSPVCVVWMMDDGVIRKLFAVNVNTQSDRISGFTKSGAPIVESREDGHLSVVAYEPNYTDRFSITQSRSSTVDVYNYMETLLLHDQPDNKVYNDVICVINLIIRFIMTFICEDDKPFESYKLILNFQADWVS